MNIRFFKEEDMDELRRIYHLYFEDDSAFPEFMTFMQAYVVEDDEGIITFGGIRSIAECITVTNKARDPRDRIKALYKILDASVFISRQFKYDHLYVWSKSPQWARRLRRNGFRPPDGQSLILDL